MAYVFGQTVNSFTAATATTITQAITHTASTRAFVFICFDSDTTTATVADTLGNTYTQVGSYLTEAGSRRMAMFSGIITTGGSTTITATLSVTQPNRGISVTTYSGLDTNVAQASNSGNQTSPGTGADAVTTGNMTPTGQPAILFAIGRDLTGGGALNAGTGFTSQGTQTNWDTNDGETSRIEDKRLTSTSAVAGTFTAAGGTDHIYSFGIVVGELVAGPTISVQPKNATALIGATASFSVTASGSGSLTYQWQDDSTGSFADIGGATSSSYTAPTLVSAYNRRQYRVNVTDTNGTTTSSTATLTVLWIPSNVWLYAGEANPNNVRLADPTVIRSGSVVTINGGIGSYSWLGTTSTFPAGTVTIDGVVGPYSWAGTTATASQLITGVVGSWSWAGTTATTSQLIQGGVGTYSWSGTTATASQLINGVVGSYTWSGTTATSSQLLAATPGAYTWAGTTATNFQYIDASVGTYSWAGTTSSIGASVVTISSTPGAYAWSGTTSNNSQLINHQTGAYSWIGTTATTVQLINASTGAYSWAGVAAGITQVINTTTGAYTWSGTTATIPSSAIDASPGLYQWTGTTAVVWGPVYTVSTHGNTVRGGIWN